MCRCGSLSSAASSSVPSRKPVDDLVHAVVKRRLIRPPALVHRAEPGLRPRRRADRCADELRALPGSPTTSNFPSSVWTVSAPVSWSASTCRQPLARPAQTSTVQRRRQGERHRQRGLLSCAVEDLSPRCRCDEPGRRCVLGGACGDEVRCALVGLVRISVDADKHASVGPLREVDRTEVVVGQRDAPLRRVGEHERRGAAGGPVLDGRDDRRHQMRQILEPGLHLEAVNDQEVVALEDLGGAGEEAGELAATRVCPGHDGRVRALCVRGLQRLDDLLDLVGARTVNAVTRATGTASASSSVSGTRTSMTQPVDVERRVAVAVLVRDGDVHQAQASVPRIGNRTDEG